MKDFVNRVKKNWKSLICSIPSLILLTIGNLWCTIVGLILGVMAIGFNLYSSDMEWEEFE